MLLVGEKQSKKLCLVPQKMLFYVRNRRPVSLGSLFSHTVTASEVSARKNCERGVRGGGMRRNLFFSLRTPHPSLLALSLASSSRAICFRVQTVEEIYEKIEGSEQSKLD